MLTPTGKPSGDRRARPDGRIIDLALFYGRNNLLINGDQGWVSGNVFATVVEGLSEMAAASQDVWDGREGAKVLTFAKSHEDWTATTRNATPRPSAPRQRTATGWSRTARPVTEASPAV